MLEDLARATQVYSRHIRETNKEGTEFVMQFSTFVRGPWKEWIVPESKSSEVLRHKNEVLVSKTKEDLILEKEPQLTIEQGKEFIKQIASKYRNGSFPKP